MFGLIRLIRKYQPDPKNSNWGAVPLYYLSLVSVAFGIVFALIRLLG